MAEPFSALTGALQVAEFGVNVCSTLYKYARDVRSAKGDIHALAEDIELVSSALKQTAQFLELEAGSRIFNDEGRATAYRAVEQCRGTFKDIRDMVQAYYRTLPNGEIVFSTFEAFKHPMKADKLFALRQRLEWPKNKLMLHLTVGLHRQHMSSKDTLAEQMERLQIRNLFDRLKETDRRSDNMKAEMKAAWTEWYAEQRAKAMQSSQPPIPTLDSVSTCYIALPAPPNGSSSDERSRRMVAPSFDYSRDSRDADKILPLITKCTTRATVLSESLAEASRSWQTASLLEIGTISQGLKATGSAVQALQWEHDRLIDSARGADNGHTPQSKATQQRPSIRCSNEAPVLPSGMTDWVTLESVWANPPSPVHLQEPASVDTWAGLEDERPTKTRKTSPGVHQHGRGYIPSKADQQQPLRRKAPFNRPTDMLTSPSLLPVGAPAFGQPPSYQTCQIHTQATPGATNGNERQGFSTLDPPLCDADRASAGGVAPTSWDAIPWTNESGIDPNLIVPFEPKAPSITPASMLASEAPSRQSSAFETILPRKRTKSGCLTCRKRRYKCGEERPFCQNCIKSDRECEGYSQRVIYKQPTFEHWATVESARNVCNDITDHPSALVDRVKDSGMDAVEFLLKHWTTQSEAMP